jgi:glycosyltransferase involved in cell wall biosynthesis
MGKVKKDLKQQIQKLGISDHVFWLEWLSSNEVDYAHSVSDLMIFPSLAESFGLPLAEAMSVGCPILAADLSYAHEVAGNAAIYFNPRSPGDLSECVISVLKSPGTLRNLVKLGKERSVLFSYEKIADQFANVIQKVVRGDNLITE